MKPNYACIRCGEDVRDATFFALKGGAHEHADCRARAEGAAAAFGLLGMAEAIGATESVRACPHCGTAPSARCYCGCCMCDPAECHYWICQTCFDAGKGFSVKYSSDDRSDPHG